jgi:hypothetical protein
MRWASIQTGWPLALRTARHTVIPAGPAGPEPAVPGPPATIQTAVLNPGNLYPRQRRARISARAVKRPLSPYAYKSLGVNRAKYKVRITIVITTATPLTNSAHP